MPETWLLQPGNNAIVCLNVYLRGSSERISRTTFIGTPLNIKGVRSTRKTLSLSGHTRLIQALVDSESEFDDGNLSEVKPDKKKKKVKTKNEKDDKFCTHVEGLENTTNIIEEKETDINQGSTSTNAIRDSTSSKSECCGVRSFSSTTREVVTESSSKWVEVELPGETSDQDLHLLMTCLLDRLEAIRLHALALEQWNAPRLLKCRRKYNVSARNLVHYAAFRSVDIHDLQKTLSSLGLANLQGIEAHTMSSLMSVCHTTHALVKASSQSSIKTRNGVTENESQFVDRRSHIASKNVDAEMSSDLTVSKSKETLSHNAENLFGPTSFGRRTYIMVTLSTEAAENGNLLLDMMKAGMNVARINCAHGNPELWKNMINNIKNFSQQLEQPCRVLMDLAGPKLRTGPFQPGPCVLKIKPHRDGYGKVIAPSQVWISSPDMPPPSDKLPDAVLPVTGRKWLETLVVGDFLKFIDARGKQRELKITEKLMGFAGVGCWAECLSTAYLESGTEFELSKKKGRVGKGKVSTLPCIEQTARVKVGDLIEIVRDPSLSQPDDLDCNKGTRIPIRVTCSFGQLFDSVKPGEAIKFDDGRIEGVICGVTLSKVSVEVTFANEKGTKLGGEKSINVPQSNLCFKGLTVKDLVDLDFIAAHADMVGLSFVNDSEDVELLQDALLRRGANHLGIVLKIETRSGLEKLPLLLLQGMQTEHPLGVMIARGDLAVECGWDSLAEMQEQLLQICEAAHVPTIWATQVLEGLTKSGLPTRAELTDAAAGARAECMMLNKGPHIVKAVATLNGILQQLPIQQNKLQTIFHPLQVSSLFQT